MAQFLLITTLLTIAGLVVTIVGGLQAGTPTEVSRHIIFALATLLAGLFSQSMTMFFFIGTGKEIKEKAEDEEDRADIVRQTKVFKARVFPAAFYSMVILGITFILGGGVHRGQIPPWVHLVLSLLTLLMYLRAYWIELRAMMANAELMERLLKE
ncbi:MAG TPA: hypothetical protein VM534_03010 [Thermoanaerobaculia bacterium]|nr:hypothetical protein [Thermoanaerobaculia bacterium]